MGGVLSELALLAFLLTINGLFSASEMSIVSSKKARLLQLADEGHAGARRALALALDPGKLLSTVQIGITLVGVLSGVFSGARAAMHIQEAIADNIPLLAPHARAISVGIMVAIVTYLSIVIGELFPKRIALHNPEAFASVAAGPMQAISRFASPIVFLLDWSTRMLLRLVGRHEQRAEPPVTGEEIMTLVEQGTQAGVFEPGEKAIMDRVLAFGDASIHAMMTPRPQIIWLDLEADYEVNRFKITAAPHSHFPLVRGTLDNVLGTVHVKDIYSYDVQTSEDLVSIVTPALFLPESSGTLSVIESFRSRGAHVAFVIDEYGNVQGLVTLTDLLEVFVGASAPEGQEIVRRDDGTFLVDGTLPIGAFKEYFNLDELPAEEKGGYKTLAGFVLTLFNRMPRTGDICEGTGLRFEVVDFDGHRIDKILVHKAAPGVTGSTERACAPPPRAIPRNS